MAQPAKTCGECFERVCSVCVVHLLIVNHADFACENFRYLRPVVVKVREAECPPV